MNLISYFNDGQPVVWLISAYGLEQLNHTSGADNYRSEMSTTLARQ